MKPDTRTNRRVHPPRSPPDRADGPNPARPAPPAVPPDPGDPPGPVRGGRAGGVRPRGPPRRPPASTESARTSRRRHPGQVLPTRAGAPEDPLAGEGGPRRQTPRQFLEPPPGRRDPGGPPVVLHRHVGRGPRGERPLRRLRPPGPPRPAARGHHGDPRPRRPGGPPGGAAAAPVDDRRDPHRCRGRRPAGPGRRGRAEGAGDRRPRSAPGSASSRARRCQRSRSRAGSTRRSPVRPMRRSTSARVASALSIARSSAATRRIVRTAPRHRSRRWFSSASRESRNWPKLPRVCRSIAPISRRRASGRAAPSPSTGRRSSPPGFGGPDRIDPGAFTGGRSRSNRGPATPRCDPGDTPPRGRPRRTTERSGLIHPVSEAPSRRPPVPRRR